VNTPLDAVRAALAGEPAWVVGGAVRDRLLGRDTDDVDVAVPGDPREPARRLAKASGGTAFQLSHEFGGWRTVGPGHTWHVDLLPILAIVGAAIMLVVGASLARAFGIVGAANLIRYRSKIEDPKDAGVMLCALAVGLASGVGLYALAAFATVFIIGALAIIESFEPKVFKRFEVHIKVEKDAGHLRPKIERVLDRYQLAYDLRTASEDELSYDVQVPFEAELDRITDSLLNADGKTQVAVDWDEKKNKVA
jgi:hypothetical protein